MAQYIIPIIFVMLMATFYILGELRMFHQGKDVYDWTKRLALFLMPLTPALQRAAFIITFIVVLSVIAMLIKMIMASLSQLG